AGLLDAGLLYPDSLGLGVATDRHTRAIGNDGATACDWLRVIGPLRLGSICWEATAVPDIREHAAAMAANLS
ncbi:MAG: hypothetical protein ACRDTD_26790, partial [Pseudonocardiaceae bacterium]